MKRTFSAAARAVCAVAVAFAAMVFTQPAAADAKPIVLTKDSVQRVIDSFPRIRILAASQALSKGKDLSKVKSPLEAVMKFAGDEEVRAQANSAVQAHGFKDFEEWARIARATAAAYLHVKTGGSRQDVEKAADKALSDLKDSGLLTEKQMRKLEKKARKQLEEDGLLNATPENIATVKSMEKDLDAIAKIGG
ncbi:MAG: hypothetical protein NW215_12030 [Hyphomicrobiales bacterium]|nr:hypothetical protein [Hyphomicrobiales bacterium]